MGYSLFFFDRCVLIQHEKTFFLTSQVLDRQTLVDFCLKNSAVGLYLNMVVLLLHTSLVICRTIGYIQYGHG